MNRANRCVGPPGGSVWTQPPPPFPACEAEALNKGFTLWLTVAQLMSHGSSPLLTRFPESFTELLDMLTG